MKAKILHENEQDNSALIEYFDEETGQTEQGIVPAELIESNSEIKDELASLIIPYGLDWEGIFESIQTNISPKDFADEFRRRKLHTKQDVLQNPDKALKAMQTVYGMTFQRLILALDNHK